MLLVFEETGLILNILVCVDLDHILIYLFTSLNVDQHRLCFWGVCLPMRAWRCASWTKTKTLT